MRMSRASSGTRRSSRSRRESRSMSGSFRATSTSRTRSITCSKAKTQRTCTCPGRCSSGSTSPPASSSRSTSSWSARARATRRATSSSVCSRAIAGAGASVTRSARDRSWRSRSTASRTTSPMCRPCSRRPVWRCRRPGPTTSRRPGRSSSGPQDASAASGSGAPRRGTRCTPVSPRSPGRTAPPISRPAVACSRPPHRSGDLGRLRTSSLRRRPGERVLRSAVTARRVCRATTRRPTATATPRARCRRRAGLAPLRLPPCRLRGTRSRSLRRSPTLS